MVKNTFISWGMNEYDICDKWSSNSSKYNEKKNKEIWDHLRSDDTYNNDFLYLIWFVKFHIKDINIKYRTHL